MMSDETPAKMTTAQFAAAILRATEHHETAGRDVGATPYLKGILVDVARSDNACGHCGRPRIGLGWVGDVRVCHTGTLPPQDDPIDCYRLVTVYGEPLGSRIPE